MVQYFFAALETLKARENEGQGMVEYALIISLIAVVVAVALATLGTNISALFDGITF